MSNEPPPSQSARGMLSRAVQFVSSPVRGAGAPDSASAAHSEEEASAQLLRERIERKRRNDFIRKAEFAQLRKLIRSRNRQSQAQAGARGGRGPADGCPSAPAVGLDDEAASGLLGRSRRGTLQKINDIEAELSRQWWQAGESGRAGMRQPEAQECAPGQVGPACLPADSAGADDAEAQAADFFLSDATLFYADAVARRFRSARARMDQTQGLYDDEVVARLRQMDDVLALLGLQEVFVHQADLEEAAILFSSQRIADTENALIEAIRKNASQAPGQQQEIWLTLLDLYRAIGQQERFDAVALDFARRFDRSPPAWVSIPELVGEIRQANESRRPLSWVSAEHLNTQGLPGMAALRQRAGASCQFNWQRLRSIEPQALGALTQLLHLLAQQQMVVQFSGTTNLQKLLEEQTMPGCSGGARDWWLARLALLRLMGQDEAYEAVALEYTVACEESPPAWVPPLAEFRDGELPGGEVGRNAQADARTPGPSVGKAVLQGRISEQVGETLDAVLADLPPDIPLEIDCGGLIVMDFVAAGSLLNWCAARNSDGQVVVLRDLHRLLAVFFSAIGINEHARIVPRKG